MGWVETWWEWWSVPRSKASLPPESRRRFFLRRMIRRMIRRMMICAKVETFLTTRERVGGGSSSGGGGSLNWRDLYTTSPDEIYKFSLKNQEISLRFRISQLKIIKLVIKLKRPLLLLSMGSRKIFPNSKHPPEIYKSRICFQQIIELKRPPPTHSTSEEIQKLSSSIIF